MLSLFTLEGHSCPHQQKRPNATTVKEEDEVTLKPGRRMLWGRCGADRAPECHTEMEPRVLPLGAQREETA